MSEKIGFEQFLSQVDGVVFHPLTLGFVGFSVLCSVIVFAMNNAKLGKSNPLKFSETLWLNYVYWFAIFFAPILAIIFVSILAMLAKVGFRILSDDTEGLLGQDNLRWYVLSFVGLLTALGGIIGTPLALIRVHTTERQTKTAEQASKVSEQNHLTEILNKAVTNLGAEKTVKRETRNGSVEKSVPALEVRSGGLLALERLARDNPDFHIEVMEILTAYIRHNAQAYVEYKGQPKEPIRPRDDLITALNVLSRRTDNQRHLEKTSNYKLQLNDTSLAGLILSNLDLSGIIFDRTDFTRSTMDHLNFSYCSFIAVSFEGATFQKCNIKEITTSKTNFSTAKFRQMSVEISAIENGWETNKFTNFYDCVINFDKEKLRPLDPMSFDCCKFEQNCLADKSNNYIAKCAFDECNFRASGVKQEQLDASYGIYDQLFDQENLLPEHLVSPRSWKDEITIDRDKWQQHIEAFMNDNLEIPI